MTDEEGWVYCMSNKSMPGVVKVGKTKNHPQERADQLFTTGVPEPFSVEFAKWVKNYSQKEKQLHSLLETQYGRPSPNREFFRCSSTDVFGLFELMEGTYLKGAESPDPFDLRKFEYKR